MHLSFGLLYEPTCFSPSQLNGYNQILQRIERSDPALTHVVLKHSLNPLFGHPEYENSTAPVFNDVSVSALCSALSLNTCITSLDLSCLVLGPQAAAVISCVTHLTSLSSIDLTDNLMSVLDIACVYRAGAAAGMTQLQQLLIFESGRQYLQCVPACDVAFSSEWARLGLPRPPRNFFEALDKTQTSIALLRFVMDGIVTAHAHLAIACSKSLTFCPVLPPPPFPPRPPRLPHLLSPPQRMRVLATGGIALLLLSSLDTPAGQPPPPLRNSRAIACGIARRVKGAAAASFELGGSGGCDDGSGGGVGGSGGGSEMVNGTTWPVMWPPRLLLLQE